VHFSLCRNVEETVQHGFDAVETIVSGSEVVAQFCPKCAVGPALNLLQQLGVNRRPPEADPPDRPCCKCGAVTVPEGTPHVVYRLTEDAIERDGCVSELDCLSESAVCMDCEAPLVSGETTDVQALLGVGGASNEPLLQGSAA
jgi:hypothetical protein